MTADVSYIDVDLDTVRRRQAAFLRMYRPGDPTLEERREAALYLAYKAVYGEPLTGEDRLLLATRIVAEHVADRVHELFRALVWELGRGFGPRVAVALDDLVLGQRS